MSGTIPDGNLGQQLDALRARVVELEAAERYRRETEAALRESEQLYRSLVETSPDIIVLTGLDGRLLMANHQAASMHGYGSPQEMLGIDVLALVAPEDHEKASSDIRRIIESGGIRDRRHVLRRKDGTSFRAEVSGSLIRDLQGGPKYILYNGRDITARERLQREMIESQKLESIGRLAGGIAHDFNNLLAVILGNASLQIRNQALPPKMRECLQDIMEAAERASSLTTQLLAYARGGLRRAVPTDINAVVTTAWEFLSRTSPPQVELVLKLAADLPRIVVDQSQVQQVVMNLCLNAIQASAIPSRVDIETSLDHVQGSRAGQLELKCGSYVVIRVEDRGCGMDTRTIERIFEPFFTMKPDNRGMGLPAALGIVQGHGGRLLVASQMGQGTQATVWLPVEAPTEAPQTTPAPTSGSPPKGTETVLIVDDDPSVTRTAEQILASLGYCVVTRTDGDEALAFLDSNAEDLDLVMLNLNMPKRTGEQMLDLILQKCPGKRVLLTSGFDQHGPIQSMLDRGAVGFLAKPFSLMSLAQAVRLALDVKWR